MLYSIKSGSLFPSFPKSVPKIWHSLVEGNNVESYHFGSGYSGWSAGQLDREIQEESWWLGPLDESLLLNLDYELRWETTIKNLGFDPLTTSFTQTGLV